MKFGIRKFTDKNFLGNPAGEPQDRNLNLCMDVST